MDYILDSKTKELVLKYHDETLKNRRCIHANPEIGLQEFETTKLIRDELDKANIKWIEASETGTIGIIEGNPNSDNILALRADNDALRIEELVESEYKSKNKGLMHACGHDAHTASLLSAGKILKENFEGKFDGKIYLLFQPGEESTIGAKTVIKSGAVNNVKAFYGQHVWSPLEIGKIVTRANAFMSGAKVFYIHVLGKSGHGSTLEKTRNPLVAASSIVLALQTIVSNNVSALESGVLCVGGISGGNQFNAIPEKCEIMGSIRYMNKQMAQNLCQRIEEIAINTAKVYGCEAQVEYGGSLSALNTDENLTKLVYKAAEKVVPKENVSEWKLELGSEDFAEYCDIAPCAYAFIGCRNEAIGANQAHHNAYFKIDEDCLDILVATYIEFAKEYFGII